MTFTTDAHGAADQSREAPRPDGRPSESSSARRSPPASESNHAIAGVLREARQAAENGTSQVIVIGVSGSGQLDLPAYSEFLAGDMADS